MAKETFNEEDGVWRTVGGRRIFIRTGQSLADAMVKSGKFKSLRSTYRKEKQKEQEEKEKKEWDEKVKKSAEENAKNKGFELSDKQIEAGNKLTEKAENGVREDIKTFLSGKEDYEGTQEDFINDLSNEWGVDKNDVEDILHEEMEKHPRLFKNDKPSENKRVGYYELENGKKTYKERELGDDERGYWTKENGVRVFKENPNYKEEKYGGKETPSNKYDNLDQYEVYEQAEKLANETNDYSLRSEINKRLDRIDRANSRGTGYANKPTSELREILKNAQEKNNIWEKQEDGSYKANKEAMKSDYEERHKRYDEKIKQLAEDRENMTNSDWEASIMAYAQQNADGTYNTFGDIYQDIEKYENEKSGRTNNEYTKEELREKFGTDNVDLINAGRESDRRVSLKGETPKENNWREQIKKNNEQMEKDLKDYTEKYDPFGRNVYKEDIKDNYYEIFRENERRNAKIKQEKPNEPYEYVEAYAGYRDKSYKLAGTKMNGKEVEEYGDKSWSGKEYTNDEFMEHLEDSNWHSERKQLLDAKLTNQELSYIKDHTTLSQWSVGEELTGKENTQKLIDEAKAKFRKSNSNDWIRNAFNEYKKEHPGTKKTFATFKKENENKE